MDNLIYFLSYNLLNLLLNIKYFIMFKNNGKILGINLLEFLGLMGWNILIRIYYI
jgi:hypothetical protein